MKIENPQSNVPDVCDYEEEKCINLEIEDAICTPSHHGKCLERERERERERCV
jgi:hypothetical protein